MKFFTAFFMFLCLICSAQELKIEKIEFINCRKLNLKFLNNLIHSKEGTVADTTIIKKDIVILNRMNGVSKATYEVTKTTENNCILKFIIVENYSLIPTLNIWTTDQQGSYRVGVNEFNAFGRNITIGGFYQYNSLNSFGLNFKYPTFFSSKLGLETNFQKISSVEPLFFKEKRAVYNYTITAIEFLNVYQLNYKNQFKAGISIFSEEYDYKSGFTSLGAPLYLKTNKKLFKFQYNYDNLEYDYYIVKGFRSSTFLQYVVTNDDANSDFKIGWNDFSYFRQIGKNGNWATRLRIGLATNNNSPFAPFAIDNNFNFRGVGNLVDRDTGTFVLNTEFRKTIFEKKWFVLQSNAFVDLGSSRNPGATFKDFAKTNNFRVYPGIGLRFIHKTIFNATFRLDYGFGITKNASQGLVFGFGQYF